MRRVLIIAAAYAPLLAACATDAPRSPLVTTPAAFEAPSRGPALPAASLDRWWTLYNDAQLTALIEEALGSSFDARTAASRLEQARAVRQAALNRFSPQGALTGSASRTRTDIIDQGGAGASALPGGFDPSAFTVEGESDAASLGFNVSWEIDLFGRRAAAARATNADSLFQARGLAIQLQEAEESLRIQEELLRVAQAKVSVGLTPGSDRSQAEANAQTSRAQVEALRAQLLAARRSLLLLLGRATDPLAVLSIPANVGTPPAAPAALPGDLLARRPDVREAEFRLASAAGNLTLAQRAFFPTFTLQPGVGLSRSADTTSSAWSIGLGATVPVLDIPRLRAELRGQRAVSEQAVLAY
jgi:outer membrane protein, multidrug efflux system